MSEINAINDTDKVISESDFNSIVGRMIIGRAFVGKTCKFIYTKTFRII